MTAEDFDRVSYDAGNPYAPPGVALTPEGGRGGLIFPDEGAEPFSVSGAFRRGSRRFRERIGLSIAVTLTAWVFGFAVQYVGLSALVGAGKQGVDRSIQAAGWVALVLVGPLLQLWIGAGLVAVLLKIARRQPASFGALFSGGRYLFRFVLASLIVLLVVGVGFFVFLVAAGVVAAAAGWDPEETGAASAFILFCLCPPLFLVASGLLGQAPFLIVDRDAGPIEALRGSLELTRGRRLGVTTLFLAAYGLYAVGVVTCCVGAVFTAPLSALAVTSGYVMLRDDPGSAPPEDSDGLEILGGPS